MKKAIGALLLIGLTNCGGIAFVPAGAPTGLISSTSTSKAVGSGAIGTKKGEACAISVLQVVTLSDASVATAAKQAGITQIGLVDNDDFNFFGVYSKHCSEVTGS